MIRMKRGDMPHLRAWGKLDDELPSKARVSADLAYFRRITTEMLLNYKQLVDFADMSRKRNEYDPSQQGDEARSRFCCRRCRCARAAVVVITPSLLPQAKEAAELALGKWMAGYFERAG